MSNLFLLAEIYARFERSEYLFCFYLFDPHNLHFLFVIADLDRIRKSKAVITVANKNFAKLIEIIRSCR